ncbi:MAG: helix-turn-helix domain-containing protein [Fibrobacterota bacterium]
MWRIKLACEVVTLNGRVFSDTATPVRYVVLDRNPTFSTKTAFASFGPDTSDLSWNGFLCGNHNVSFAFSWNDSEICARIKVEDDYIYSDYTPGLYLQNSIWANDFVMLYYEPAHRHACFLDKDVRAIQISPKGDAQLYDPAALTSFPDTGHIIRVLSTLHGTLNNNSDSDSGYSLVVNIPRAYMGTTRNDTLGLDVVVGDREGGDSAMMRGDWVNLGQLNAGNPSEWGNLVLVPKKTRLVPVIICIMAFSALLLASFLYVRKRGRNKAGVEKRSEHPLIGMVASYVGENGFNEDFSLESTARHFNLNKDYLGKLFKREIGETFSNYLNKIRVEKTKQLLIETPSNITQIAFEVGYESLDTFQKAFKRWAGVTPSQYRKDAMGERKGQDTGRYND